MGISIGTACGATAGTTLSSFNINKIIGKLMD